MITAKPRVLVCTRQICRVWKLRVYIYIHTIIYICISYIIIIFCVYIGATLIGNVEVEMTLSNNIQQLFKNLDLLRIITPLICWFQYTFWATHCFFFVLTLFAVMLSQSKTATGRNDAAPPRPSKRRPLQSLWSWWCCRRFEAGGHKEHTATGDPLQKQPGNVVD